MRFASLRNRSPVVGRRGLLSRPGSRPGVCRPGRRSAQLPMIAVGRTQQGHQDQPNGSHSGAEQREGPERHGLKTRRAAREPSSPALRDAVGECLVPDARSGVPASRGPAVRRSKSCRCRQRSPLLELLTPVRTLGGLLGDLSLLRPGGRRAARRSACPRRRSQFLLRGPRACRSRADTPWRCGVLTRTSTTEILPSSSFAGEQSLRDDPAQRLGEPQRPISRSAAREHRMQAAQWWP